jgi:tetratricopeptide (TPR) repeat protein
VRSDREGRLRADAKHAQGPGLSLVLDGGDSRHYPRLADDQPALREQVYAGQVDAALPGYQALVASGGIVGSERYLNFQGYRLVEQERHAQAVAVFDLVTRLFPESANAWDSLGDGLGRAGRRDESRQAYRRALDLDPEMATAKAALEDLRE